MLDQTLRDSVGRLNQADRLALISELWESIEVDELEITPAEREMLDARLADREGDPDSGRSWDSVEVDLRARIR